METKDEETLATLEKQLTCPICLELFNKPVVILPCQHNLCRKCANQLYQPSLFQARSSSVASGVRFCCPSCRQGVLLDRHGVYGLPRNLLLENIVDVYKQEVSNTSATSPLPPPSTAPGQVTCSDHADEKVNIYCVSCRVPTCSLCKVFGAHQSCQVAPLTDVYQQQKDELSEGVRSLVEVNSRVQALIGELEDACRNIEDDCRAQRSTVCEKFNHVLSILEERQKVMTQRISSEQEEKTGHVQALMGLYGDSLEANRKLMERAAGGLEEPDMAAFVQNSRELIKKVTAASACYPADSLKPGDECLRRFRYNFSRQERALRSIAFIKEAEDVPEEQQPEEPKDSSVQNVQLKHQQETSNQDLDSEEEPAQLAPAQVLVMEPVDSDVRVNDGEPAQKEDQEEEEDPVKGGNVCEDQGETQQTVTLIFYLLAFLVLLQRFWAYVGCFVCT